MALAERHGILIGWGSTFYMIHIDKRNEEGGVRGLPSLGLPLPILVGSCVPCGVHLVLCFGWCAGGCACRLFILGRDPVLYKDISLPFANGGQGPDESSSF
jgi:hypothetical protein